MALSKIQAESMNLADTFAFTGTVSGAEGAEEGTWTPVMTSFNHTTRVARYIKIGKLVTVYAHIYGTSTRSGGSISVGGLPYTTNNTTSFYQSAVVGGHSVFAYSGFDDITARFDPNSTNLTFLRNRQSNNHDGVQASQQGSSAQIFHIGGTYIAN